METITENTISELRVLFEFSPPHELRKNLMAAFFQYLNSVETDAMPKDFKSVCESFQFLIRFLEQAEAKQP